MVQISMLEFIRTGQFGPLRLGMSRNEVKELLGPHPLWGTQKYQSVANIWRYEDIEFYFDNDLLKMIFTDHENLCNGGESLRIDPWVICRHLPISEFKEALSKQNISFQEIVWKIDSQQHQIVCDSGIVFSFLEEPEDIKEEKGLIWWETSIQNKY